MRCASPEDAQSLLFLLPTLLCTLPLLLDILQLFVTEELMALLF